MAELLFWPALLAYGEAAVAYFGETRIPGWPGRLATWGVRLGWLAQTALLIAQAARADGFPWSTWAGSLNLFVWFVVTAYLIWGCRARFRLLGLAVTPLAAALFVVARVGGGTSLDERPGSSTLFLVLKEEVRLKLVRSTEQHRENVILRRQEAVIERIPVEQLSTEPGSGLASPRLP